MPSWDRPRTGGDNPGGDDARRRFNPNLFSPYPSASRDRMPPMPRDRPLRAERARENDEGTGWPRDKSEAADKGNEKNAEKADESPEKTRIRELESELGKTRAELRYAHDELLSTSRELGKTRGELREAQEERSKLVDTVSRQGRQLERKDTEIQELRSPASVLASKEADVAAQDRMVDKKPGRRSWFPSEKVSTAVSGGIAAFGAVGVATHQLTGSTESAIVAGAGFGFAVLALAKDKYEKPKAKEKKDADRPAGQ